MLDRQSIRTSEKIAAEERAVGDCSCGLRQNPRNKLYRLMPKSISAYLLGRSRRRIRTFMRYGGSRCCQRQPVLYGQKEAGTSLERLQNRVNDFATVEKFRNNTLNAADLNKFVSDILLWTNPTLDINGNTTRQTMPPALIEALKYRYDKGMDTFGIPEDLFGVDSSGENLTTFESRIIDPNVSLTAATGLLSGLQRAINYAFEQTLGETPLGAGSTVFKDTSEGTKALLSLRQATSRFLIEGKTLAQEFADMKAELVDPSMFSSDIDALNALKAQRSLLTDQRARVQEVIKNPQRYTNPDKSKARELYTYAGQLLSAYDSAITSYQRGLGLEDSGETSGRPPIDTFFRD
jgi:hypothetical protein